jgi:hypothetical protein
MGPKLSRSSPAAATGDQRGVEYLHEALKFLDPVKEPVATANALSNEARFHHLAGRHRTAIDLLKRAADLVAPTAAADEVSSFAAPIISNIYAYLQARHQHYGPTTIRMDWARTAIEFGERRNVSFAQAIGYEFLAENGIHAGDYRAGLQFAEKEREIVERIIHGERRAWTHFSIVSFRSCLGI